MFMYFAYLMLITGNYCNWFIFVLNSYCIASFVSYRIQVSYYDIAVGSSGLGSQGGGWGYSRISVYCLVKCYRKYKLSEFAESIHVVGLTFSHNAFPRQHRVSAIIIICAVEYVKLISISNISTSGSFHMKSNDIKKSPMHILRFLTLIPFLLTNGKCSDRLLLWFRSL